jgi:hypothetical protein
MFYITSKFEISTVPRKGDEDRRQLYVLIAGSMDFVTPLLCCLYNIKESN